MLGKGGVSFFFFNFYVCTVTEKVGHYGINVDVIKPIAFGNLINSTQTLTYAARWFFLLDDEAEKHIVTQLKSRALFYVFLMLPESCSVAFI